MDEEIYAEIGGKILRPLKGSVDPSFQTKNVRTNEPWTFVSLWLKREKKEDSLFYWEQAREFFYASLDLPVPIRLSQTPTRYSGVVPVT